MQLKARTGGEEGTTPVTTACPEAGNESKSVIKINTSKNNHSTLNFQARAS